ncbi:hypothetical protein BHE97_17040 [Aeromicrobium sp. PE09-221]|nr:hypothetical protein BHE97_17040 [Aeromicrobium sp. PE09-221]
MNPNNQEQNHQPWSRSDPTPDRGPTESAGPGGAPDAVQAADLGQRHNRELEDRDLNDEATAKAEEQESRQEHRRGRGVEWVRPTELLTRTGGVASGRGISFQAELARTVRAPVVDRLQRVGERARQLPPLAAFGRSSRRDGTGRSSVGMS